MAQCAVDVLVRKDEPEFRPRYRSADRHHAPRVVHPTILPSRPSRLGRPELLPDKPGDPTHVSFGGGIHHWLGAPLARLEVDVALERLTARCPKLQLAGNPVRPPRFVLRGFNSLELVLA